MKLISFVMRWRRRRRRRRWWWCKKGLQRRHVTTVGYRWCRRCVHHRRGRRSPVRLGERRSRRRTGIFSHLSLSSFSLWIQEDKLVVNYLVSLLVDFDMFLWSQEQPKLIYCNHETLTFAFSFPCVCICLMTASTMYCKYKSSVFWSLCCWG